MAGAPIQFGSFGPCGCCGTICTAGCPLPTSGVMATIVTIYGTCTVPTIFVSGPGLFFGIGPGSANPTCAPFLITVFLLCGSLACGGVTYGPPRLIVQLYPGSGSLPDLVCDTACKCQPPPFSAPDACVGPPTYTCSPFLMEFLDFTHCIAAGPSTYINALTYTM